MMSDTDRRILETLAARMRERFPEARVWAYGSRARGDALHDSDYDVCIVVSELDEVTDQRISDIAFEVGWENDVLITTVTYSREQFERGPLALSPLVASIRKEGVPA